MASDVETGRITTDIPARMDRLPWARWHWLVVIGLGHRVDPRRARGHHRRLDVGGPQARRHRARAHQLRHRPRRCASTSPAPASGALFFGQLTDQFGRKKLFLVTLGVYTVATVATAFAPNPLWYFIARFFTGVGIGGEYAAINSAIDELIPKAYRGRVDVAINGSFWVGAALRLAAHHPAPRPRRSSTRRSAGGSPSGSAASSPSACSSCAGTCPRARAGCSSTAATRRPRRSSRPSRRPVDEETGGALPDDRGRVDHDPPAPHHLHRRDRPHRRSRSTRGARSSASRSSSARRSSTTPSSSPTATRLTTFFDVKQTGWYLAVFAVSNFLGALLLSPLFDTVGRVRMISGHLRPVRRPARRSPASRSAALNAITLTIFGCRHLLLRLRRRERRVPHGERGVPARDPGAVHRVLLRDRHGRRRHQRPAAVRQAHRQRVGEQGHHRARDRLLHRCRAHGGRRASSRPFLGVKAEGQSLESIAQPLTAEDATRRRRPDGGRREPAPSSA